MRSCKNSVRKLNPLNWDDERHRQTTEGQRDRHAYIHTYIHTHIQTDRQTDRQTDGQTDERTNRQSDRQTDRRTAYVTKRT